MMQESFFIQKVFKYKEKKHVHLKCYIRLNTEAVEANW